MYVLHVNTSVHSKNAAIMTIQENFKCVSFSIVTIALHSQIFHDQLPWYSDVILFEIDQDRQHMIKNITNFEYSPAFFHGHFAFLPFPEPKPIYINLIRDPLDRLVSYYYFLRHGDNFRKGLARSKQGKRVFICSRFISKPTCGLKCVI